jgi:hypothetical protein
VPHFWHLEQELHSTKRKEKGNKGSWRYISENPPSFYILSSPLFQTTLLKHNLVNRGKKESKQEDTEE